MHIVTAQENNMQLTKGQTCLYFSFLHFVGYVSLNFVFECASPLVGISLSFLDSLLTCYCMLLYHWISYFYDFELNRSITISNRDRIIWNSISNKIDIECEII